ncbi:MAG TPA: PfkB family carbohydrate kinase, partial [Acidimicrobiales bacterium]
RALLRRGARAVVCTLGERGSLLVTDDKSLHVTTERVDAVDTTGAGDAYVGSLAFFLARGVALDDAMRRASRIAGMSVCKPGTQPSFPSAQELPAGLL